MLKFVFRKSEGYSNYINYKNNAVRNLKFSNKAL